MKIAVWHNLPSGGGKRALYCYVRGLLERGHVVESWCPPTADQTYLPLGELVKEHIVPFEWEKQESRLPLYSLNAYLDSFKKLEAMKQHSQQCAEAINQGGFDLLFAHSCRFYGAPFIGRYTKTASYLYLQEPYRRLYEAMPKLPWVALEATQSTWWSPKYIRRFLSDLVKVQELRIQAREELLNAQAFDHILVNSYFSRESILRAYGLDAQVCYLGIDTALFQHLHQPRENFVVGVGSFTVAKNIGFVIKALAKVKESRPALVWIGNFADPSYLKEIQQLAANLNVDFQPKVRVDDQELVKLLNQALATVYTPRLEPFGYGPLEANACGLPVIAIAEGGIRETVIHGFNGLIAENDTVSIADAIQQLADNPEYAKKLGQNGHHFVTEKWSIESALDRLEKRLANLLYQKK
ncbi:glycosyltransferase family 4 protein [Stenomitos frigidus]|uniref:Glycosyl transferase family 1 domain-containing protein n=1 Tax=Stenomitos frigidus ULC18 TaxID=2107698 RepID=A0A2T1ESQ2_9CYAN|nr:glycosyltransferase family 4 protein [Stenomitos frigidus]PSB35723.1 hypothetical protein C7B82_00440 [Stenomitos frigidus ULC18]